MDEVTRIKKSLDKITPKGEREALELLKSLESIPMTLDVLKRTQIGMTVNKIRKSVDSSEISTLSKNMIKRWKKLLSSCTTNETTASTTTTNNPTININDKFERTDKTNVAEKNNSLNTSNNSTDPNLHNSPTLASNQAAATSEKSIIQKEIPVTTSEVRLKCRALLTDALKKPLPADMTSEPFLEEDVLAANIEECIFREFKNTDMKYKTRIRSRVSNLGDIKNPYLKWNVLRGDISAEKIAKMTADEMASDELKKQREKFTKEAINDHQMSLTTGTKTSDIKCPACRKYDVTYNQVQTRSADEPMTTFCYCNLCGKRWKFC